VEAAGQLDDLLLLAHAPTMSEVKPAVLHSWFSLAVVKHAPAAMAGVGNSMDLQLRVTLPRIGSSDLIADRARLRELLGHGKQSLTW
jgi:hypothetical protein